MKVKKVRVDIRSVENVLDDAKSVMKAPAEGKTAQTETGVYSTSFEAFRKALTPRRLELLHAIKAARPRSLHELAEVTKRDIKNVSEDVEYLEQIGLIEKRGDRREVVPVIGYDRIALEIATKAGGRDVSLRCRRHVLRGHIPCQGEQHAELARPIRR
jgi:predicted transcriptional regulator